MPIFGPLSAGLSGWVKVFDQSITSGTSTVQISGLNGNVDKMYMVFVDASFSGIPNGSVRCSWNGTLEFGVSKQCLIDNSPALSAQSIGLAQVGRGNSTVVCAMALIGARTANKNCLFHGENDGAFAYIGGANSTDTTTNITSIVIDAATNNGTFSGGRVILWKPV